MIRKAVSLALVAGFTLAVAAGERGTREEATGLVSKAVKMLEEKGAEELIRMVNERKKPFTDRDLYLFVIGPESRIVAHGFDESRVGILAEDLYDGDGQPYGSLFLKLADENGRWVSYKAFDPITGRMAKKTSLVRRSGDYILGCGVYE